MKKELFVLLAALAVIAGCSNQGSGTDTINAVFGPEPNTIDPTLNLTGDSAIYIAHMFEGLYRYADNGQGDAVLVPGLSAEIPGKKVNEDGTVVYTFTLRDGLKWSDGKSLTADDLVYSWQRLVDPATAADYSYIINMVKNAAEIIGGKLDKSELGIKATDDKSLEITLTYDCPFFDNILAFTAAVPLRRDCIETGGGLWTFSTSSYISNGPYRLKEWVHNSFLLLEKNPYYYKDTAGPEYIRFYLMEDANATLAGFRNKELDFIDNIPVDETSKLLDSGLLKTTPELATSYVLFNNKNPPFDDARVRKAFTLAVDRNFIVNNITRAGETPAAGIVPYGTHDAEGAGSDFRKIGGNYYSTNENDYEKNCAEARNLLTEAGYPGGAGFPIVEYIYNTNDTNRSIAEALQNMWKTVLGVKVTLSNQDWAVFIDTRKKGAFQIARSSWMADFNDPVNFLDLFVSGNNISRYSNPGFDALMREAHSTAAEKDRMSLFHKAEDILIGQDMAVCPLSFSTKHYMLNPEIRGVYHNLLDLFLFDNAIKNEVMKD
jgi:oligopeptide transport system substrate-binding protein